MMQVLFFIKVLRMHKKANNTTDRMVSYVDDHTGIMKPPFLVFLDTSFIQFFKYFIF